MLALGVFAFSVAASACAYDDVVESGGGKLHIYIEDNQFQLPARSIVHWIQRSADIVSAYYGRFPASKAYVAVTGGEGRGVMNGIALGGPEAVVNVKIGLTTNAQDLGEDWVLVHELIHIAFPKVPTPQHWAEEGLSVYVESVARAQAGDVSAEQIWQHFVEGMPNGLPQAEDNGLDNTPTWGRTYWGGAMFFLLADIEIIKRSGGRKSLRDGLRAIVDAGFDISRQADVSHMFRIADKAVAYPVLTDLYERMRGAAVAVDLNGLWRQLGVVQDAQGITFVDSAELAEIRKAISLPGL